MTPNCTPSAGRTKTAVALCVLSLALPGVGRAEIYGWIDSSGELTYGNLPPPKGARVTDSIRETPISAQQIEQEYHDVQIRARDDRIRLKEIEDAAREHQIVDYSGPPPAPPGVGCGPGSAYECDPQWGPLDPQWGPFVSMGALPYGPYRNQWGLRSHQGGKSPRGENKRPGTSPLVVRPMPPAAAAPIAASPNRSSIKSTQ